MNSPSAPIAHLALLSSISFGGFPTVLPDVRNFVVANHGWMTDQDFVNFFALAQAVPGPIMILMMGLVGGKVWDRTIGIGCQSGGKAQRCKNVR
jgi:chromate transport protein ChrA